MCSEVYVDITPWLCGLWVISTSTAGVISGHASLLTMLYILQIISIINYYVPVNNYL